MTFIDYQEFEDNSKRPCLYVTIENPENPHRRTKPIQMVVDTGSDFCIFSNEIAEDLDIDLSAAPKQTVHVAGGGLATMAAWPVRIVAPQLGHSFLVTVRFGEFAEGLGGVLGMKGFLRWMHLCFVYDAGISVEDFVSKPPYGAMPLGPRSTD